ncbi:hypothetical protein OHT61_00350 [Streptomyces sp. NBC_00178]|uniref:hypothetical protein n=1 Tax=Streptomyces sp. NBC_00178 TaxID=2975672 RepID=UPI002E2CC91E|nr:hypothetical protein [Streptomyces sp. NBC_00178]
MLDINGPHSLTCTVRAGQVRPQAQHGRPALGRQAVTPTGTVTGAEKRARGHIPGPLHSDVGSSYSAFVQAARLVATVGI